MEKKLKIKLDQIGKALVDEEKKVHVENLIGATSIPLGIAGPLKIKGDGVKGDFYLPLTTTEGALVASVNRGCKAITLSGGASTWLENIGATRGPVFKTKNIKESFKFKKWLIDHFAVLKKEAEKTSSHLTLKKSETRVVGNLVFVRFYFDTEEAMGMNMVTIATSSMIQIIEAKTGIKCISLAGNFDIDKKPAWLNFLSGRGKRVWAEVVVKEKIIKKVLKTTADQIFEVWLSKCLVGSALSGSLAFNAQFANIVAAFFAATGQDLAHVSEGSLGLTSTKVLPDKSLYISVYLPALMIGTVGGGTKFKTQKQGQNMVGVEKATELAQVLGAAVLAGEASLLASLAEGSLAKAHEKLGR